MEENQTRYLPHCIIPPPSSHVPGNLDVREEQARPSNKRTFADLDGVDSRADSLVGFSAQPASDENGGGVNRGRGGRGDERAQIKTVGSPSSSPSPSPPPPSPVPAPPSSPSPPPSSSKSPLSLSPPPSSPSSLPRSPPPSSPPSSQSSPLPPSSSPPPPPPPSPPSDVQEDEEEEAAENPPPPIPAPTPSPRPSPPPPPSLLPLSLGDISKFEEDGFVMLRGAFDPAVASACREALWGRLGAEGIFQQCPSTWVNKKGIAEIYGIPSSPTGRRGHPWTSALSPKLKAAVNQLVGEGAWEAFGCGWWVVTFPGFAQPPWQVEGRWHVDGAHFRHFPHSREIGLLPIFLFSDVLPSGGGTALLRGSHKKVASIIWEHAGTTGMTGPEVSSAAREALLPALDEDVVETAGAAGDVMLTHPLLLHARSSNLAGIDTPGVRFMCHPAVPLKHHFDFRASPESFSVVQRTLWNAHPSRRQDGQNMDDPSPASIITPEECDHSAVPLPAVCGFARGRGRRLGRGRGKGYRKGRGSGK